MNRRWIALLAVVVLVFPLVVAPSRAQSATDGTNLSLAEALRTALANNLDLVSARKDPEIAEQGIEAALGPFDPLLSADATLADSSFDETRTTDTGTGPVVQDTSSGSQRWSAGAGLAHLLDFGGTYTLDYRIGSNTQDPTRFYNFGSTGIYEADSDDQSLRLGYRMPLLRGLGKENNMVDVLLARSGLDISRSDLRLSAMLTMQTVENAYWDLVAVRAARDVAHQSLKLAQDLLDLNKKKVEVGTLAPIEITQAEAGVAAREEAVIQAENALEAAEDRLLQLLAVPQDSPLWSTSIVPTDRPIEPGATPALDSVLTKALEIRPEMEVARQTVKDRELSERVARNGTRHGLDLATSVAISETDSSSQARIDLPAGVSRDATSTDGGPDWSVGLVYSYPLHNRTAKASAKSATLNREKAEIGLQNTEQSIRVDVRNAVRNVESGVKRVKAAQASTILQQKKLEAEQKKFDNGMSTSFEVLTFQTDLADAQVAEIRARLDYVKALADLERAQGTLLEARGLQLE